MARSMAPASAPLPGPAPEVHGPAQVPQLRTYLVEAWRPGAFWWHQAPLLTVSGNPGAFAEHEQRGLREATLYWVAPDLVELLNAAAGGVPDEVGQDELVRPSPTGLVVFGAPIAGIDAKTGEEVVVDALLWDDVMLPRRDGGEPAAGLSVSTYRFVPRDDARFEVFRGMCLPLGRSDWPGVEALGQRPVLYPAPLSDDGWASFLEDRRLVAALWALIESPGIAEARTEVAARPVRRKAERAGVTGSPDVRVINLRHQPARAAPAGEAGPRRAPDHRWVVSGHWRRQAVGPGRVDRRLTFVAPHVKGPEGAPLKVREKVYAVRR